MRDTVDILGVNVDTINMDQVLDKIVNFTKTEGLKTVYTPNSEIIMTAKSDNELKELLNSADLLIADGIGVVIASRLVGKPISERVTGFDTITNLFKIAQDGNISFYFFGGEPGIVYKARENLESLYPNINIIGSHNGFFSEEDEKSIIDEINNLKPDILLVGLGAPKQEKWINKYKDKLDAKVCMGIGGCFDVIAGKVKRAPLAFQKLGLEWFYRLLKQPSRFKRSLKLPQFALTVFWNSLFKKR